MSQATQGAPAPNRRRHRPRRSSVRPPRRPRLRAPAARRRTSRSAPRARTTSPAARRRRSRRPSPDCGSARSWSACSSAPLTGLQLALSWQANRTAAADTEQLIRVQGIKTNLLRADALATNAFLIGGLEPAEQRAAYDGAIDQTVRADHRRGRGAARRPRRAQRAEQRGARLRRRHGAGAGQQPPGPAGRGRVPAQGEQRAAVDRAADRRPAGGLQLDPARPTRWAPTIPGGCSCRRWSPWCCCGSPTAGSGGGSTVG